MKYRIHEEYPNYGVFFNGKIKNLKFRRILKLTPNNKGYPKVVIKHISGRFDSVLVHRLVAILYVNNPDNLPYALHKDNDPSNPHYKNLYWGTQKENLDYAIECGRLVQFKPLIQYTLQGKLVKRWESASQAHLVGGYSKSAISMVCKGQRKSHRGYKWSQE